MYGFKCELDNLPWRHKVVKLFIHNNMETTAHGIPNYFRARGRFKSYFWGIAGLASTFALFYCLVGLVEKYLSYPKNVVISFKTPDELTFPSVTFCNMNPVKESHVNVRKKRQVGGECPTDWEGYESKCFYMSFEKESFDDGEVQCKKRNARLASIADENELNFILKALVRKEVSHWWFGLFKARPGANAQTYFLDGNPSKYRNWGNSGSNKGAQCISGDQKGFYKESDCKEVFYYLCLKEATSSKISQTDKSTKSLVTITTIPTDIITASTTIFSSPTTITRTSPTTSPTTPIALLTTTPTSSSRASLTATPTSSLTASPATSPTTSTTSPTASQITSQTTSTTSQITSQTTSQIISQTTSPIASPIASQTTPSTTSLTTSLTTSTTSLATSTTSKTTPLATSATLQTTSSLTTSTIPQTTSTTSSATSTTSLATSTELRSETSISTKMFSTTEFLTYSDEPNVLISTTTQYDSPWNYENVSSKEMKCCCTCCRDSTCASSIRGSLNASTESAMTLLDALKNPSSIVTFQGPTVLNNSRFPGRLALNEEFKKQEMYFESFLNLSAEKRKQIGYERDDVILACFYQGEACDSESDFVEFNNPIHGNCWVFNSGWNENSSLKMATETGHGSG